MNFKRKFNKLNPFSKNHETTWLSTLIDEEKKNYKSQSYWERFKRFISTLYMPSKCTIWLIVKLVVIILIAINSGEILTCFGLENLIFIRVPYISIESNQFQNLIAIHAGIGTIIFALFILVAESLRDNQYKNTAEVLLKVSFLFPLTVAEITFFFLFLCWDVNFLSVVSVISIGLLTIISLKNTIEVLLDKNKFTQKRIELLNDQIAKKVDQAIDERIGNNIFLSKVKENQSFEFEIFPPDISEYYIINSEKLGNLIDINFSIIQKIIELIWIEFLLNEVSKLDLLTSFSDSPDELSDTVKSIIKRNSIQILVHKRYKQNINEENRVLLSFPKAYLKDDIRLENIQSMTQKAFIIESQDSYDDQIKPHLADLKGQYIDAIINHRINVIQELFNIYIGITEGYLSCMKSYGGGFSFEQARKERSSLFMGGWDQMRWLTSDVRNIIDEAIQCKNREIIYETIRLPIRILRLSLEYDDHYLFQEFKDFPVIFYNYSHSESLTSQSRLLLFDRSWRYIKELSSYYIEAKLKKDSLKNKRHSFKNFALTLIITFQDLLKSAYDKKDVTGFKKFLNITLSIFERSTRNTLDTELQLLFQEIQKSKFQMLFGLASWILDEYQNFQGNQNIQDMYNEIQTVFNIPIKEFTSIFINAHSDDVEDFWGWGNWVIIPEGSASFIQILEKLELFYTVKSLSLLQNQSEEIISQIELPFNRDFANLAKGSRDLTNILENIKDNPENWLFVLTHDAIEKVNPFKDLLLNTKSRQEDEDIKRKRNTQISNSKIIEFKEDFVKGFYKNAIFRNFIKSNSQIVKKLSDRPENIQYKFGLSTVDDKAVFFDSWHEIFTGWGEHYGQNFVVGENYELLKKIIENCECLEKQNIFRFFQNFSDKKDILIIFINTSPFLYFRHENDPNFDYSKITYKYQDTLIPIFEFFNNKIENQIIILDKNSIQKLIQYSPLDEGEDENLVEDIFSMNIRSFSENEDLLHEFLENPPEWLFEKGDRDSQILYLQELVLIRIFERFELVLSDDFQGYRMLLDE